MTVKLVLLKSGEKLISDVKEGFIEEKLICYLLEKPCTISVNGTYKVLDEEDGGNKVSISLHSWPAFSNQKTIEIPPSWIVTLVEPSDEIKEMYENQVLGLNKEEKENDQSIVFTEQPDSDQQD
jgi:hypothetical protein